MTVPVDEESFLLLQEAVIQGRLSSGTLVDSGARSPVAPWIDGPEDPRVERQMSEALRVASIPAEQIREMLPAARPQQLFPEQEGYDQEPPGVEDMFDKNRWAPRGRAWTTVARQLPPGVGPAGSSRSGGTVNPML